MVSTSTSKARLSRSIPETRNFKTPGDAVHREPHLGFCAKLSEHFGPGFMISLVPERLRQIPSGLPGAMAASFGVLSGHPRMPFATSCRSLMCRITTTRPARSRGLGWRDLISRARVDLSRRHDGTAAATASTLEAIPSSSSPPMPADIRSPSDIFPYRRQRPPTIVTQAMDYIITGKSSGPEPPTSWRAPGGYPGMIGAMFWTIDGRPPRQLQIFSKRPFGPPTPRVIRRLKVDSL